jgi:NAD(P)-dependent dehydrogenase (short-subunit alcohol dehydrogenase family)
LITGGSSGLGAEMVRRFREEGAAVVFTGRDAGRCESVAAESGASFVLADARSGDDTERAVRQAVEVMGGLDTLVLNAGTGLVAPLLETPLAEFERIMDTNVTACLRSIQAAIAELGRDRRGSVVLISSDAGVIGEDDIGAYSVSKAAVLMLGRMLAVDCGPLSVRVNMICPGDIAPGMREMLAPGDDSREDDMERWPVPPLGRIGAAQDVAGAAVFFASDDSSFCSGSMLLVDGGMRSGMRRGGRPEM